MEGGGGAIDILQTVSFAPGRTQPSISGIMRLATSESDIKFEKFLRLDVRLTIIEEHGALLNVLHE